MEKIKDTVQNLMELWHNKQKLVSAENPGALLNKIFTKQELKHIQFGYLRKGILGLTVDSSAWIFKLNLKKESLLDKIGKHLTTVKDIRFVLGDM